MCALWRERLGTPGINKNGGRSLREIAAVKEGLADAQADIDRKEAERVANLPSTKLTKQNIALMREVAAIEKEIANRNAYAAPDEGLDVERLRLRPDDTSTVADVEQAMIKAYDVLTDYLAKKGLKLGPSGQEKMRLYTEVQRPPVELRSAEAFVTVFHRMRELELFVDDDFEPIETEPVDPGRLSGVKSRLDPQPDVEIEEEPTRENPHPVHSVEHRRWEKEQYHRDLIRETEPIWRTALKPFVERGAGPITRQEQNRFFDRCKKRGIVWTVPAIQAELIKVYPDAADPNDTDQTLAAEMTKTENLSSSEFLKHFGLSVRDYRGWAPRRNIGQIN
jgi:hypothetical protein